MTSLVKRWKAETLEFTAATTAHGIERAGARQRPPWYLVRVL